MNTNMSRRSFLVGSGSAVLAAFLTACGSNDAAKGSAGSAAKGSGKTIYVLTPSEDHGWTGSVATFAKEKIEEVNKAGVYKAELQTADSASKQIQEVEDILAGNTDEIAGIVIQPMDDTVQSAIQSIVDAGIPYVAFDRIIEAVADTAVSNVKGDNEGIGAGSAAYFVENGMKRATRYTCTRVTPPPSPPCATAALASTSPVRSSLTARRSPTTPSGPRTRLTTLLPSPAP